MSGPSTQIEALVVRTIDYGDADRIVHLLTSQGRVEGFAHGAKKSKKRFQGALEPFTSITATLTETKRQSLPTLSTASVRKARLGIRSSLENIALGSYVTELGLKVSQDGEHTGEVLRLVESILDSLAEHPATMALRRAFELRLMAELGYAPQLERCVVCGEDAEPGYLDFTRGGLLCAAHRSGAPEVGPKTLAWMRAVFQSESPNADGGLGDEWADRASRKLTGSMSAFYKSLISTPLHSVALLDDVAL